MTKKPSELIAETLIQAIEKFPKPLLRDTDASELVMDLGAHLAARFHKGASDGNLREVIPSLVGLVLVKGASAVQLRRRRAELLHVLSQRKVR